MPKYRPDLENQPGLGGGDGSILLAVVFWAILTNIASWIW